jgi:hypothetical protein
MAHRRSRILLTVVCVALIAACAPRPEDGRSTRRSIYFEDATAVLGLPTEPTRSFGALSADHDDDGDLDLFVNRHADIASLYATQEGRFVQTVSTFMRQEGYLDLDGRVDRHGCAWGEANGDRLLDLYCTQGAKQGTSTGPNQLFLGGDGRFVESAQLLGVADLYGRGRTVNWLDHDLDHDLDLFVLNAVRDGYPSSFFRNDKGAFEQVDLGIRPSTSGWPTSTWADWDGDVDPDLLVLDGDAGAIAYRNHRGRYRRVAFTSVPHAHWISATWTDVDADARIDLHLISKTRSLVLRNSKAGFVPIHDMRLRVGRMSAWLDIENDGDLDAFIVQGAHGSGPRRGRTNVPDVLLLNDAGDLRRVDQPSLRGPAAGNGDAAVTGDFDQDGRVDLFVANGHNPWAWEGEGRLYRNASDAWNSIALTLVGDRWNPRAFGARIRVDNGAFSYWRHVTDGVSSRAQSASDLILGIGDARRAEIVVEWPDGSRGCWTVPAGGGLVARMGTSTCGVP